MKQETGENSIMKSFVTLGLTTYQVTNQAGLDGWVIWHARGE
jgi:hypothetical protein